ncbi:hypothetical protein SAMN06297144_3489 [Sphingomonas guangdongensis]|uniref:Uncharacterized protein n=1 Tax=Sphingomonas guangdongensis TaxID=1141890 RepID=A0A285R3J9_9SPHN|nr:hypothetical protein [Sphingomonas guangdongensis]SOB88338.1 hypothetical protein SAMN06297144_3489 [Sphingomonas guangdongensis]
MSERPSVDDLPPDVGAAMQHAFGPVRLALPLALAGVLAAIARATFLPALPREVALILIALALGVMLIGTVRRIRLGWQHVRRMRK